MPEAIMQRTYGKSNVLNIEKIYVNDPADDEILIKQTAIGIHFHDVYVRTGLYKTLNLPGIPGIEAAGVVEKKGRNVNNLNIGDRVVYITGSYGAYASHRVINHNIVAKIPNELDDATMATNFSRALTVNMLTEQVFNLKDKTTVLVTAAAGGVGRLLCQYLNSIGKIVIGTVGSEEKIKVAKSWGCKEAFIYNDKKICEYSKDITKGIGFDLVYDSVGFDTFEQSFDLASNCGYLINFGQSSGPIPAMEMSKLDKNLINFSSYFISLYKSKKLI
ncbi:MAG: quinone oxidoreductase [Pelagibacteraceae bacterium]|nr:MAG: quinone oxidoreductase [Pelagibacteraceae bacterium]